MKNVIFHVDMDAFFASVEQRDRPQFKGKPVIVGGLGQRGVVSAASYEARRFGVHSAQPMVKAKQLCPQGHFLSPRMKCYSDISREVMTVFRDFSPLVEPLSVDEAFLDMSGTEKLFGMPMDAAQQVKDAIYEKTQLTCSIGVAPNKFLAKLSSELNKPNGVTDFLKPNISEIIAPFPLKKLWGVGPKTLTQLETLGYFTFGDVQQASPQTLTHHLGKHGAVLQRLAWGKDDREVTPATERKSIGSENTFNQDIVGQDRVCAHLRKQCGEVAKELRRKGFRAQGVRVKIRYSQGFKTQTAQIKASSSIQDGATLYQAAIQTLSRFNLDQPIRLVGVAAFDFLMNEGQTQMALFEETHQAELQEKRERLEHLGDAIQQKYGDHTVLT
ncbi:MAG: DNA polymerase IV [Myxococcales bacterium]|nr:DNA polymerase IV [Myxococcales bacterium]